MSTPTRKANVKAVLVASASAQTSTLGGADDEAAADLDRILGDTTLFMLNEARPKLRVSMPRLYRAMRAGPAVPPWRNSCCWRPRWIAGSHGSPMHAYAWCMWRKRPGAAPR